MKKNKKDYTLLIIICVILLAILGIMFFNDDDKEIIDFNNEPEYKLLNDYSRFFTVDSCVYKYISLLSMDNKDNLLNVIDDEYIENNNLTKNNIYQFIPKLDGIYSFKSKKIYYQKFNDDFIKYYVYGYLIQEEMDEIINKVDYYVIIKMDIKNNLFSVTPYDGNLFKEDKNG